MLYSSLSFSQEDKVTQAQQIAISSMSLVDALASRYPGARKYIDRMGNNNIALRGRQSFKTAGNQVLWEIDGVLYNNPPSLYANQVKYVEILNGLAATNRYGSEGAGGVVVVKTNVSAEKFNSRKNLWNKSLQIPNKKKDKKAKKKKKDKKS
jgi:hypothetical protein|tara:strand:+ start:562 stop:1017 length:456 start_codon:yes stop_codon:yes gene_type:complete